MFGYFPGVTIHNYHFEGKRTVITHDPNQTDSNWFIKEIVWEEGEEEEIKDERKTEVKEDEKWTIKGKREKLTATQFIIDRVNEILGKNTTEQFVKDQASLLHVLDECNNPCSSETYLLLTGFLSISNPKSRAESGNFEQMFYQLFEGKYKLNELLEVGNLIIQS